MTCTRSIVRCHLLAGLLGGLMIALAGPASSVSASPAVVPLRGVVEGFYGTPWQQTERMDILTFCGKQQLNAYIYAPKDDPYHRAKWREPYPPNKMTELAQLIQTARLQGVRFVFAVSPGLDIHFTGFDGYKDKLAMEKKLSAMYDLGVRDFAIFFDDIKEKDGKGQADFLNWLNDHFIKAHPDISPLITVPTEYFYQDMQENGILKPYSHDFAAALESDILVLYTGNQVVSDGITDAELAAADHLYGRNLGIWWNYPVTDYMENKLALGPVENLPHKSQMPAIFFNPMKHEQLSKIALATGADYALDPFAYQPQQSWEKAIEKQYGALAPAMKQVAAQSQHLENSWAKVGRPDGPALRKHMDIYWQTAEGSLQRQQAAQDILHQLESLSQSAGHLQAELPASTLAECQPQLQQLQRIIAADKSGLALLTGHSSPNAPTAADAAVLRETFVRQLQEVRLHDKEAVISETSARAFLNELAAAAGVQ